MLASEDMQRVSMTELRRDFSRFMERVGSGECFVITRYGKDVVVLLPFEVYQDLINLGESLL